MVQRVANGAVHVLERLDRRLRVDDARTGGKIDFDESVTGEEDAGSAVTLEGNEARMIHDGYGEFEVFWRIALPIALPALSTTVILNTILLWNEFLYAVVLITDESKRTLPLGIQKFMGDQLEDIGMIATGLMIAIIPVVLIYAFFSEKLIRGMTAGAMK